MTQEQRDIIMFGLALVIYGLADAWTHGWRPRDLLHVPALPDEVTHFGYLERIKDDLVREEHDA